MNSNPNLIAEGSWKELAEHIKQQTKPTFRYSFDKWHKKRLSNQS